MDLLIAILMALGAITSPDQLNSDFASHEGNQELVNQAQDIMETGGYTYDERGGVVITGGVGN